MKPPAWLQRAVIYQIFVDRFFQGGVQHPRRARPRDGEPVFCGGNLQGVAEKLDYLSDLGVNTIWLSPFNKTTAYHGYHITDFFRVDERFGGQKGFQTLVNAVKSRNFRLIMDFVPNHVHDTHPWFQAAQTNEPSRYRPWFYWQRNGDYLKFLDVRELPKLNLDHPAARKEMIRAARFWMDQGVDGLRLDHALGPSLDFWRDFREQLKEHKEDVALIAEVFFWNFQRGYLPTIHLPDKRFYFLAAQLGFDVLAATMREYAGVFDGLLDFHFQKTLRDFVAVSMKKTSGAVVQKMLDDHYASFPWDCALLSFLDNHDMNRFLFEAGGNNSRLIKAAEIQFAQRHPPVIYYGTEIGMSQAAPFSTGPYGDLPARGMMTWNKQDSRILENYKRLIQKWKSRHKAD